MNFVTPSRKARFAQLGYLFKHTFTIFGRDLSIVRPIVKMIVYACVMLAAFSAGLVLILYQISGGGWLLFAGVVLFFYKFFYYNRVSLVLSRMVYVSATGGDPKAKKARQHLSGLHLQVFVLGLLDMLIAWIRRSKKKEGGIVKNLLFGGIAGLGDLVSHFLLPVFAVDKHSLRDSLGTLGTLKDNIPESLGGVFGIAIMGRIVSAVVSPLYAIGIIAGIGVGLLWGGHMPAGFSAGEIGAAYPIPDDWPLIGPHTVFSWLPLFCVLVLGTVLQAVLARIVDAIKVVYYTLFYTRINHADELAPDLREELEGYLKLEGDADKGDEPVPVQ